MREITYKDVGMSKEDFDLLSTERKSLLIFGKYKEKIKELEVIGNECFAYIKSISDIDMRWDAYCEFSKIDGDFNISSRRSWSDLIA